MSLEEIQKFIPVFVLVLFRIAGLMLYAPLLGSAKIPKRVKALFALVLAMSLAGNVAMPASLPSTAWGTAVGIGAEIIFGFAMGMVMSFVFIAAQWAGEMVGQQMGFNMSEVFDPQYGGASSVVGDMYYMLTLVVFLVAGGHRQMILGIRESFDSIPLLSAGMNANIFDVVLKAFSASTTLAIRLAAPVMITLMIVDLALGFIARTMPQINAMSAGMNIKSMIGLLVLIFGVGAMSTPRVLEDAVNTSMTTARNIWHFGVTPAAQ